MHCSQWERLALAGPGTFALQLTSDWMQSNEPSEPFSARRGSLRDRGSMLDTRHVAAAAAGFAVIAVLVLAFPLNLCGALLGCAVARIAVSDLNFRIVPDLDVAAIFIGGVLACLLGVSPPTSFLSGAELLTRIADIGLAVTVVGGGLWAIAAVFKRVTGREGLGLGDVKLLAAWCSWLPVMAIVDAITIAAVVAIALMLGGRWTMPTRRWQLSELRPHHPRRNLLSYAAMALPRR